MYRNEYFKDGSEVHCEKLRFGKGEREENVQFSERGEIRRKIPVLAAICGARPRHKNLSKLACM